MVAFFTSYNYWKNLLTFILTGVLCFLFILALMWAKDYRSDNKDEPTKLSITK